MIKDIIVAALFICGIGFMLFVAVDVQGACNKSGGIMVRQMVGYSCVHINGVKP